MKLSLFDAFSKAKGEHVLSRTSMGAIITIASVVITLFLAASEFMFFQEVINEHHVKIDTRAGERNLTIALDVSFFHLSCADLGVGLRDSKGNKYPADAKHLVMTEWKHQEGTSTLPGCRVAGTLDVRMVEGTVFFTMKQFISPPPGQLTIINFSDLTHFNASHRVESLVFGPSFPGKSSPLAGNTAVVPLAGAQWQYHVKVVPTKYIPLGADPADGIESEEYSVTQFLQSLEGENPSLVQPGMFINYDISPVMVWKTSRRKSLMQFITSLFAIVGGVFSVAGLLNAGAHRSIDVIKKLD